MELQQAKQPQQRGRQQGRTRRMAQPTVVGQNQGSGSAANVSKRPAAEGARGAGETAGAEARGEARPASHGAPEAVANGAGVNAPAPGSKSSKSKSRKNAAGLSIERRFTSDQQKPFDAVVWERRSSVISNPD